jgi:hypothetical protein
MTIYFNVGRRVPRRWLKRQGEKLQGILSFQEHIWTMIKSGLSQATKKANACAKDDQKYAGLKFVLTKDEEVEDLNYIIEWQKLIIQGTEEQEADEMKDIQDFYKPLGVLFKKDMPKDENLNKHFKTKILTATKVTEAYEKGYGAVSDNNIANKLLEMGIITHIEWVKDHESRPPVF